MRMQCVKMTLIVAAVFSVHCGNTGIYDDALTVYSRVVRPGLNEWYPLNGNLSSRVGSIDGTATGQYTASTNRAGEAGKAVCTTNSTFNFTQNTFGAAAFTVSAWVQLNTLTAGPNGLIQRGTPQTGYNGFQVSQSGANPLSMIYGDASFTRSSIGLSMVAGQWYFIAFSHNGSTGAYYMGPYSGTLSSMPPITGAISQYLLSAFQIFANVVNACADDILHYNRALTSAEVQQNFLSVE